MNEDYERVHLTDRIYIIEEQIRMEKEIMEEMNKEEAKIFVINNITNDKIGTNVRSFRGTSQEGIQSRHDVSSEASTQGEM